MKDGSASLNDNAQRIADGMVRDAERLRIEVSKGPSGESLIDAGAKVRAVSRPGCAWRKPRWAASATSRRCWTARSEKWPLTVEVRSSQPVLACLASQYAGWNLSSDGYFAMGSGPARALARVEPLFEKLTYKDAASSAVLVLETAEPPPPSGRAKSRQGDRAGGRPAHLPLRSDPEPRRHRADRLARARSGAAQGQRS